jgi:hypothetical protein
LTCTLVLSSFDLPTHSASGLIWRHIAPRVEPFQLYGPLARRPAFSATAQQSDLIVGTGHGAPDEYSAQHESPIWIAGQYNPKEVEGKVIKLVSCETGAVLGPDLVKNGARCFMGYDDDLIWLADADYYSKPWDDPYACTCLLPIIDCLQALLDGKPCGEAYAIEQAGYTANAQANDQGQGPVGDFDLLQSCLAYNAQHSILLGDPAATIHPRPKINLPAPPPMLF